MTERNPQDVDASDLRRLRHDLKTPLNAIIGYGEMLEDEAGESGRDELAADARHISAAGLGLVAIIESIFDASNPPTPRQIAERSTAEIVPPTTRVRDLCAGWISRLADSDEDLHHFLRSVEAACGVLLAQVQELQGEFGQLSEEGDPPARA